MTTATQDSIDTYEITIPGKDVIKLRGTHSEAWARVEREMRGQPDGVIPTVRKVAGAIVTAPPSVVASTSEEDEDTNADDKARSVNDLLAAQAAGFAPKRPYYDRGTPVIDLGVQNARASQHAWEAMPRLPEAVGAFCDHVASENRRDVIVPLDSLAMRSDGTLTGKGEVWHVEPEALTQLATRLHVPSPAFLVGVWPELRARVWNQMLATATGHEKSTCPPEHALRTELDAGNHVRARLRNGSGPTSMWAALSDSYAVYDVDQIARALGQGLANLPDARCEVEYDGRSAKIDVLFHSNVQPKRYVAGEFFKAGLRVRTSDSGGGSVHVSVLLYQNLCLNLICIDVASYTLARLRHIGNGDVLAERFARAVQQGQDALGHFLQAWGFATEQSLMAGGRFVNKDALRVLDEMSDGDTFSEDELLLGVFGGLRKVGDLSIGKDDLPGLLAAHARDTSSARELVPVTRASVVNAITRYAHEGIGRHSPAKQAVLESEAGALIVGGRGGKPAPLPFLPPKRETNLAL